MSITSIHRETPQTMNLNPSFLLLIQMFVHGCSSCTILCLLFCFLMNVNATMYKGGCLYPISLLVSKAIKSRIKFLSNCINSIKCRLSTKDESYPLKVHYNTQRCLLLNDSFKICTTIPKQFQNLCWLIQLVSASALARLMCWRCSCIILLGLKTFMGSCP
jgi:hypothetical protein